MPIFEGAFAAGADYLDMAMSLSRPDPAAPYERTGVKLGDEQFGKATDWEAAGRLALVGIGVEPGLSDVFARYAADHLFDEIDEIGVRDGANLVVDGYDFAPSFSIWTTIEECLNLPVVWERERGWYTTPPFSEPETFDFPEGIGPVECVNVEHEEVLLIPRWVNARRVTFKYGLGDEFIGVLKTLHMLGSTGPRSCGRRGRGGATGRGGRRAPGSRHARRPHARQDLCRRVGDGHEGRPCSRGLPVPRGRQRDDHGPRWLPGRRLADRDQPGRGARTARVRDMVRTPASSVRRRSTQCPSSIC